MLLNNIQFKVKHIWNMTGGVDNGVLELICQGCGGTSNQKV